MTFRRISVSFLIVLAISAAVLATGVADARAARSFQAVSFGDEHRGWYTGSDGNGNIVIWKTTDGGVTLKRQSAHRGVSAGIGYLAVISKSVGLWADDTGVRFTRNGGATWREGSRQGFWVPVGIGLASAKVGWASGAFGSDGLGGTISRSIDGGRTWRSVKTVAAATPGNTFAPLSCPTSQRCYVLGRGSLRGLWATSDAGKHWVKRRLPGSDSYSFGSVDFPTSLTGWVVGRNGTVLKTVDGGVNWKRQASGSGLGLSKICFTDATYGFAVGAEGVILHTDDGGKQWTRQSSGTTSDLWDVCFIDRRHGWAVGYDVRLRTTDGGKTWKKL